MASMWAYVSVASLVVCSGAILFVRSYGKRRKSHYLELAAERQRLIAGKEPHLPRPNR